jgi:hypothetical protein
MRCHALRRSERRTADRRWSGAQPLPRRHLFNLHKRICIGQPFVTPKALLASHLRRTTEQQSSATRSHASRTRIETATTHREIKPPA